jgi:Fic family protein
LYISDFFETHRQAYYDALTKVRVDDNLEQWIMFFLEGVIETTKKSKQTFENILKLREISENEILKLSYSNYFNFDINFIRNVNNNIVFKNYRAIRVEAVMVLKLLLLLMKGL